jgi:hypothetical protein
MELSTFLILLIFAVIFISIGFMIPETKYKIAYFMILMLLCLSILNIYLSVVYYIQLRNDPGIPGEQGSKGVRGAKGSPGKCSFSEKCGIQNARTIILNTANQMYDIPQDCLDKPSLTTCKDQNTLDEAMPINKQINMLEKIAYSTTMSQKDFESKLKVCLQDSNDCMDPTNF